MKTGHTLAAATCSSARPSKVDAQVISVVTGEPTEAARESDTRSCSSSAARSTDRSQPLRRSSRGAQIPVASRTSRPRSIRSATYASRSRNGERVRVTLVAPKELEGPRAAGTLVGTATVFRSGKQVHEVPLRLRTAVPAPPFAAVMLHAIWHAPAVACIACALIA